MTPRERIIEAATGLFIRHGYGRTSMELVASEAGLTRQALYHHFDGKEALFRAVVEAVEDGAHAAAMAAGAAREAEGTGLAEVLTTQIAARWEHMLAVAKGSPHAEELVSAHQRQSADLHRAFAEKEAEMFVATIARFAARGPALRSGVSAAALAECVQTAAKAAKEAGPAQIETMLRLMVAGALEPPGGASEQREPER